MQKNKLLKAGLLAVFLSSLLPFCTVAQVPKAYDLVVYSGRLNEKIVRLNLADGYISYSTIIVTDKKHHHQLKFEPDSSDPDKDAHLNFISYLPGRKDHFVLDSIQGAYNGDHPTVIRGNYYAAGKVWPVRIFLKASGKLKQEKI